MLINRLMAAFSIMFLVASCSCSGNKKTSSIFADADTAKLPPVETKGANTDYKPAFPGQTRIAGVKTRTAYVAEKINSDMQRPWAVVPMPDGRLLITEKSGYMQIHDADGKMLKKITGIPEVDDRGQGGMVIF